MNRCDTCAHEPTWKTWDQKVFHGVCGKRWMLPQGSTEVAIFHKKRLYFALSGPWELEITECPGWAGKDGAA